VLAELNDPIVQVVYGDQSDQMTIKELCSKGPFDIIIDDASHVPRYITVREGFPKEPFMPYTNLSVKPLRKKIDVMHAFCS